MMKKYRKKTTEVEAIQYNGTVESFNEIRNSIEEEKRDSFIYIEGERQESVFSVFCKTGVMRVYDSEWIVKDGNYYFVVSNDIFQDMFIEIE